jgi:transposase
MRVKITKTKNAENFYIIKSTYIDKKHSTKIVEKLGNIEEVKLKADGKDPYLWAREYAKDLTIKEKEGTRTIAKYYSQNKLLNKNENNYFNVGYLFLQDLYYKLELFPASKLKTLELSKKLLEQPNFEYQHIERALPVLCKESDFIQSELYKNSKKYMPRNNRILYYDCTNFFFEIECEDDFRKYGKSKENRPNPIVQMGLFMDGDGIPLSCEITPGNTNEQITLKPLEEKIIKDFELADIVVCTDAGLASNANRKFNDTKSRKFITTQSLKKLKSFLKEEALDLTKDWHLSGSDKTYNIEKLRTDETLIETYKDKTFYKERWIKENGIEQRLIITYSTKYQEYQKNIRNNQINRAKKLIEENPKKIGKSKQNDPKRFIETTNTTSNGEIAEEIHYSINQSIIEEESKYDGLYAVCTNLEDSVEDIIKVNHRRWEIEESFRIMKTEFNARPVFHSNEDAIKAHFLICFLSLTIYRYLEKKLEEKYTVGDIIDTLKNMSLTLKDGDYIPHYVRTDLTDELHDKFGFRTDYEIISKKNIKKICKLTKN